MIIENYYTIKFIYWKGANMKKGVKIVLWTMLTFSIMIIYLGLVSPIEEATGRDLIISRLQYVMMGVLMIIATILHMNSEKIAFFHGKVIKTICVIWGAYFFAITVFTSVTHMMFTNEYQQFLADGQTKDKSNEEDLSKLTEDKTDSLAALSSADEEKASVESNDDNDVIINHNSIYSRLSEEEFTLLVKLIGKSFYSFNLSNEDYDITSEHSNVMECLTRIYDYAYENNWKLDPEFSSCFSERWNENLSTNHTEISNILESNFNYGVELDLQTKEWKYDLESYSFKPDDLIKYNDEYYVDADGYIGKGVILYSFDSDNLVAVAEIKDIEYNKVIEGWDGSHVVPFGIFIEYYGEEAYWKDGEDVLRTSKRISGKPLYYVKVLDINRVIKKEEY